LRFVHFRFNCRTGLRVRIAHLFVYRIVLGFQRLPLGFLIAREIELLMQLVGEDHARVHAALMHTGSVHTMMSHAGCSYAYQTENADCRDD
jgi:hypothetical protein